MEAGIFHTHRTVSWPLEKPSGRRGLGKGLQKLAQGGLSALYLHLLSLRVGLLGWYFCLKQIQWDLLCWIHTSMELAMDVLFCWLQNVLLAWVLLLLLAWKACEGAKNLGLPLLRGLFLLNSGFWKLEHLLAQAVWAPISCVAWMMASFVRILEVSYEQAARMAQEEEEEEDEDQELLALFLRREDGI